MKIRCLCIDDSSRPNEIPINKWVVKDKEYNIIHIYIHPNQGNIQGVDLAEIQLDKSNLPYDTFRLSRFVILKDDLDKLFQLMKLCSELNDIDIEKLIEQIETVKV